MKLGLCDEVANVFRSGIGDGWSSNPAFTVEQITAVILIQLLYSLPRNVIWMIYEMNKKTILVANQLVDGNGSWWIRSFAFDGSTGLQYKTAHEGSVPASKDEATVEEPYKVHVVIVESILGVVSTGEAVDSAFNTACRVS